jgi:sensor domain CHASE-containing protein
MMRRNRNFLIISASLTIFLLVLMLLARVVVLKSYLQIEEDETREHIDRIDAALQNEVDHLSGICSDYATWNDSYRFVKGEYPDFVRLNLDDDSLKKLRLNFVSFIAPDGDEIYSKVVDLQGVNFNPYTVLRPDLLKGAPLLDLKSGASGFLVAGGMPIVVSSRPVLTSEGNGPVAGILIMGRIVDARELAHLRRLVRLPLEVTVSNSSPPEAAFPGEKLPLRLDRPQLIRRQSVRQLTVYQLFADINHKPGFVISAKMERTIYAQGVETLRQFMLSAVVAMLLAILVINRLSLKIIFAEKSRLITETLYNYVVEESQAAALLLEAENCRIVKSTAGFSRLLGYPPEQLEGVLFREMIAGSREEFERCRTAALESGASTAAAALQLCCHDRTQQTFAAMMTLKTNEGREFLLVKLILPRS